MLPRKDLIPLKSDFERIHKTGKVFDSPSFGLVVSYGASDGPKAAFIVSKKIDKKSVIRHQIKRKLADSVLPFLASLDNKVELVFLAKGKAKERSAADLAAEAEKVLKRERLLK